MDVLTGEVTADELTRWPHLSRTELLDRLALVIRELFGLYQELAMVRANEQQAKVDAWRSSGGDGETIAARDRAARQAALPASIAVVELANRVEALEVAKEFGYFLAGLG